MQGKIWATRYSALRNSILSNFEHKPVESVPKNKSSVCTLNLETYSLVKSEFRSKTDPSQVRFHLALVMQATILHLVQLCVKGESEFSILINHFACFGDESRAEVGRGSPGPAVSSRITLAQSVNSAVWTPANDAVLSSVGMAHWLLLSKIRVLISFD